MKELVLPVWMDRVLRDIGDKSPRRIRVEKTDILEEFHIVREPDILEELEVE